MKDTVHRILMHWNRIPHKVSTGTPMPNIKLLQYDGLCLVLEGNQLSYSGTDVTSKSNVSLFNVIHKRVQEVDLKNKLIKLEDQHKKELDAEGKSHPAMLNFDDLNRVITQINTLIPEDGTVATKRLNRLFRKLQAADFKPTQEFKPNEE